MHKPPPFQFSKSAYIAATVNPINAMSVPFHAPFLDGLRGYAALLVVYFHGVVENRWQVFYGFRPGQPAVHIFFVLSAFLLTYRTIASYSGMMKRCNAQCDSNYQLLSRSKSESTLAWHDEEEQEGQECIKPFRNKLLKEQFKFWFTYTLNRFVRVFPLFMAIAFVFHHSKGVQSSYMANPSITGWDLITFQKAPYVFWTLRVEFAYYLVIPFLVLFYYHALTQHSKQQLFKVLFYISSISVVFLSPLWKHKNDEHYKEKTMLGHFQIFFLGSVSGLLQFELEQQGWKPALHPTDRLKSIYAYTSTILFVFWSFISNQHYQTLFGRVLPFLKWYNSLCHDGLWISIMLLLTYWAKDSSTFSNVMSHPIPRFFGKISFSMYILHPIVLHWAFKKWQLHVILGGIAGDKDLYQSSLDCLLVSMVLVALLSYVTFTLIEEPCMKLCKWFTSSSIAKW